MSSPNVDKLGNNIEEEEIILKAPREIVKPNKSSKKRDMPPPSADPSRARRNMNIVSGNNHTVYDNTEALLKDRSVGREQNLRKDIPVSAILSSEDRAIKGERRATDRHSRSGKIDSKKKVNQGWGDSKRELYDEIAANNDAIDEIKEDRTLGIMSETITNADESDLEEESM